MVLTNHFSIITTGVSRAGVGIGCQDLTRQDVEDEPTGMYSRRVLAVSAHPGSPHRVYSEEVRPGTGREAGLGHVLATNLGNRLHKPTD